MYTKEIIYNVAVHPIPWNNYITPTKWVYKKKKVFLVNMMQEAQKKAVLLLFIANRPQIINLF
jgi:hypothetical protein